ncbi:hypothetical protein C1X59_24425 [Pseudomonas sp. FW215-R2]|uniref:DUF2971 domain-containing protein n=1 Tax=unclassified Pseudomonas TaxID=196821 RepID=UPI000C87E43F|nr:MULTISPECIES: DUF2971 domain-containing protein [unclassified Pseudomonas]PMW96608.1 hypothetical protein C1X59_24425 [Pseudomonas sp. FW215-R2]PMX05984.1 hypothetical protein C1X60_25895 [Pseudomonas sp. FW215-L1]PMX15553.1 hypothetical protein C1X57_29800 [Pseudomonas sp. FW215-E1]PNA22637.1 hypothetical protein C1X58_26775 [Pseudomonas sp. FW215-R4]
MDTIYRFRPVSRLLNEDGQSGELDSQYIYFADPVQLNDPLEGYKDLIFSGDRVVWGSLIRHYVSCLVDNCLRHSASPIEEQLDNSIEIFTSQRDLSSKANEINRKVYERLVSEPAISKYIDFFSSDRDIHQHELVSHLNLIHSSALATVFEIFHELKLFDGNPAPLIKERQDHLGYIESMLEKIPTLGAQDEILSALFKAIREISNEIQILRKCNASKSSENPAWTFIRYEYPEAFCKELEKLVYPNWYTACFMEGCADSSIWGTYGGNHQDVCLKFKVDNNDENPSIKLNTPVGYGANGVEMSFIKHKLHKVSYDKNFVRVDFFRSLGRLTAPQLNDWYYSTTGETSICAENVLEDEEKWRKDYWENFYHSVTVKLKAWDREQEWRIVMAPNATDLSNMERRKFKYEFNCLEGIIFGIKTTLNDKTKIILRVHELCKELDRSEFNFYQARYDETSKAITYDQLNLIKVGIKREADTSKSLSIKSE